MKTINVTFVSTWPVVSDGIATFCDNLATSLPLEMNGQKINWDVVEVLRFPKTKDYLPEKVKFSFNPDDANYSEIANKINGSKTDVVIIQFINALYADNGRKILDLIDGLKKPIMIILHSIPMLESQKDVKYKQKLLKDMSRRNISVVVMSNTAKKFLQNKLGFSENSVYRIYHGAPIFKKVNDGEREKIREELGFKKEDFVVFSYGILRQDKGVEQLIESMEKVKSTDRNIKLLITGSDQDRGAYSNILKDKISNLGLSGNVVFIEKFLSEEEIGIYLQITDVLVLPQNNLGLHSSGTISYGLSAGALIISTPIFHAKEVLPNRGIIIENNSPQTIADALLKVVGDKDLQVSLRKSSYKFGEEIYWSKLSKKYINIVMNILDNESSS